MLSHIRNDKNDFVSLKKLSFMKSFFYYIIIASFLAACSSTSTDLEEDKNTELKVIDTLESELIALAASSTCNDETSCAYIAFGSKPCGGPWSYLVYSNSIDTQEFVKKVAQFNEMQQAYNIKHNIISDCAFINQPSDLICKDGKCSAVYN